MDDQNSLEKQRRRKLETLPPQRNINPVGVTNVAKLPNTTTNTVVVNSSAFDAHAVYGAQNSAQNKLAKLPNVSQILSVSNESAQTVPMNGAQPLPPISTVAGGSCTPNFTNMGAYSGVGLPNMANVALPIGVQLGEADTKHNSNETDPNSLPIGVVSVPNVNFVPVHVGEMSLFTDANGSVCAAPSGFHMPFHVPFSGIISIPSAIMATQIDGSNSNAQGMPNMVGMGPDPKVESASVQAQPPPPPPQQQQQQQQQGQPQYGVQLSNAQALFGSTQSPALFGAQMPTFAAAFVSQPIAFIGSPAVNVGGTMPNQIAIATQNSMPMMQNQSCVTQHVDTNTHTHHLASLTSTSGMHSQNTHMQLSTQEQSSSSPSLVEPPSTVDKPRRGRRPGVNYGKRQAKVAMRMSSLDEVFALFSDTKPNAANASAHPGDARQAKGGWPKSDDPLDQSSSLYDDMAPGSDAARRMKAKRANRTDPGSHNLQDTASGSAERLNNTLDDDFMELLRSVVENDGAGSSTDVNAQRKSAPAAQSASSQPIRTAVRQKRPRVSLTDEQRNALETAFSQSGRLSRKRVTLIAARVGLPESAVIKCYAARRRKLKMTRDALNAGADLNDPTALKRRPMRSKTGPTTNYMSCLDDSFFNNVIGDESAVCKSSRDRLPPTRPEHARASTAAMSSLDRSMNVSAKTRAAIPDTSAQAASNSMRAMQMQQRAVTTACNPGQLMGGAGATLKCEGLSGPRTAGPCATDISSLLVNRLRAEADSDSPTDIVLPTIDTSLLPALDGGSILSAATAMLPTADELSMNLDLGVCASDVLQQSG